MFMLCVYFALHVLVRCTIFFVYILVKSVYYLRLCCWLMRQY